MYSRYGDNGNRSVRLPEHYGGSVFQQLPTEPIPVPKRELPRPYPRDGIGEKASPVADRLLRAEVEQEREVDVPSALNVPTMLDVPEAPKDLKDEKEEAPSSCSVDKKTTAFPIHFEGLRRLLGGEGGDGDRDRLLLLGLILLLSRTEGDSDVLLWLSLLLLCG